MNYLEIQSTTELNEILTSSPQNLIKEIKLDDNTTENNSYDSNSTISNENSIANNSSNAMHNYFDLTNNNNKQLFLNDSLLLDLISNEAIQSESLSDSKLILEKLLNNLKRISQDLNKQNKASIQANSNPNTTTTPLVETSVSITQTSTESIPTTIVTSTSIATKESTQTNDNRNIISSMTTSIYTETQTSTNIPITIVETKPSTVLSSSSVIATKLKEMTTMLTDKDSTLYTTNSLFIKLTSSANMVDTLLNEKISLNGKNYTVVNITEIDPFNPLLSLGLWLFIFRNIIFKA